VSSLDDYLRETRALVDAALRDALAALVACPPSLLEAMRYSLLAPGKRLRPLLLLMACEACGGEERKALPAACAVEMVHTYSLIHDDLPAMDDDDLRRGLPTCHKKYGEAMAILAGDALLTLAFQVLTEHYPPATASPMCRDLASRAGAEGMVGGQVLDLTWEEKEGWHELGRLEALAEIHMRKTGALIRSCLRLGALAAQGERPGGPDPALLESLDGFGLRFGLAFQITDDLLDVEGDAAQAGKRLRKDAGRGKLTYPGLLGVAERRRRAERLCLEACNALAPLGDSGARLAQLARYVLERDR
jgi:geranylgeranyl diphosphate synthase type II